MKRHFEISHRCKISSFGLRSALLLLLPAVRQTVERETLIFTGDFYLPTKPEQLAQLRLAGSVSSS